MSANAGPTRAEYVELPAPPTEDDVRKWPGAICTACKRVFARDAAYKTMCIPCFKAGFGAPRVPSDNAHLWLQLALHRMLADLRASEAKNKALTVQLEEAIRARGSK